MKSLFTIINDKVYEIQQNMFIPTRFGTITDDSCDVIHECSPRTTYVRMKLGTIGQNDLYSNKEKANMLIKLLHDKQITEIIPIKNSYRIYIDYSIFEGVSEKQHNIIIESIAPSDILIPLGINEENECCYRRCKLLNYNASLKSDTRIQYGIMSAPKREKEVIVINDIIIFQDMLDDIHNSINGVPFPYGSSTINSSLENSIVVYSSKAEGVKFNPVDISGYSSSINIDVEILLSDFTVIYDNKTIYNEIDSIIKEIEDSKNPPIPDPPTDDSNGEETP